MCKDADLLYPKHQFDYNKYPEPFRKFELEDDGYAGKGHFSFVRKCKLKDGRQVAIKEFKIFNKKNLIRELQVLKAIENVPNTLKLVGLTGDEKLPSVIYSYHTSTKNAYENITEANFKWWLHELLVTLAGIHERGVLHRDVKLGNILVDFERHQLTLIDFGLAEFNRHSEPRNPKPGCIRLKSPEITVGYPYFDCSSDVWAAGIACLDIMFGLGSYWEGNSKDKIMQLIIRTFGSKSWNNFASVYNDEFVVASDTTGDIFEFIVPGNERLINPLILDLVQKMLNLDPSKRITAAEALHHPYFKDFNETIFT
ncbi:CMGC family protein kinase [Histomonas meleagridis]|uniref:CMGC family protein kinase n=1 Tax=Histomonas meleagridis TaxID=135588 RepID=UPI003559E0A3|nr:CMGC family protein kinase [Histomonas meleagridis]KAH0796414.1 CMGC family protein kinase [Histomonas meleagridis]